MAAASAVVSSVSSVSQSWLSYIVERLLPKSSQKVSLVNQSGIPLCIEQCTDSGHIFDAHLENPTLAIRIRIDQGRIGFHVRIAFYDFTRKRCIDVAGCFDRFYHCRGITKVNCAAHGGEFNKNNIGQFRLSVVCDTYSCDVAIDTNSPKRLSRPHRRPPRPRPARVTGC